MQMVLRRAVTGRLTAAFLAALAVPATGQNCEGSDLDEYDFMVRQQTRETRDRIAVDFFLSGDLCDT